MVNPDDALCVEFLFQVLFYLLFRHGLVAMGRQQTAGGGKDRSLAIALYGTTFEYEVQTVHVFALHLTLIVETPIDGVVEFGRELLAPAVEAEVEQPGVALIVHKGDKAMIASPSVVGGFSYHQQLLALLYLTGHFPVGGNDLIEHWSPIRISVRPG